MPSGGLSSPLLAPKGQLMKKHSTAVLPILILLLSIVLLLASSCEARGIPVYGKVRSSSKSHRLPGKDLAATSSLNADGWLTRQMKTRHMAQQEQADAKVNEGMKMAAPSADAARATPPTPAVTISRRLSRQEDTGFHLDYAGPRTHTPSHN